MVETHPPQKEAPEIESTIVERESPATRVILDPSSPSVRSIIRVAIVALIIFFIAGSLENIIVSITPLIFLIVLSVLVAYLVDPLVRLIRHPFKQRSLAKWMPRSLAIVISYLFVILVLGGAIASIAPRVGEQAKEFGTNLPTYSQAFRTRVNEINRRFDRLRVPDEVQAELNKKITDLGSEITAWLGNFVLISVTYLPWFILVPILSFFFLKDVNLFRLTVLRMFPAGRWRSAPNPLWPTST